MSDFEKLPTTNGELHIVNLDNVTSITTYQNTVSIWYGDNQQFPNATATFDNEEKAREWVDKVYLDY